MAKRSIPEVANLIVTDLKDNRGRRIRHGLVWRTRRLQNRREGRPQAQGAAPAVYSVAFGDNGERVLGNLQEYGDSYGLKMMFGGSQRPMARTVHIGWEQIEPFLRLLSEECSTFGIYLRRRGKWRQMISESSVTRLIGSAKSFDILIIESVLPGVREHHCCSRIEVAVWKPGSGPYGQKFRESDRAFALVGRLREATFDQFSANGHDFDSDHPCPVQPDFPVDVVYTWVDDGDEEWQEQKAWYREENCDDLPDRVLHDERFRNRDELKYSLRSLELFAPWVRKIHIVTANQTPSWLDVDHPKINLVSHGDIYSDQSWLPTFNSSSIETQLHHIPGLSQKFIYFNDDFLLGQLCEPSDFFFANGIIKFFPSSQRAYEGDIDETSEEYVQADKNALSLFQEMMPTTGRSIMRHVPYASDRDLVAEIEQRWPDEFAACAAERFRSSRDLRPLAFMQYHYGYHRRMAMSSRISHRYLALWKPNIGGQMNSVLRKRSYKTICINDVGLAPEREPEVNQAVVEFLESYYPAPSQFEK